MRLFHYSARPLTLPLYAVDQDLASEQFVHSKPKGLWLSVKGEDDWPHWCQAEQFNLANLAHGHEIQLSPDAEVLKLSCAIDIDLFTERYGRHTPHTYSGDRAIAWSVVARDHQGIIIAPYIRSRRLNGGTNWYYGWDCASGCIWDVSAIADVAMPESVAA